MRSEGGVFMSIVARPGRWRDALQAALGEIPCVEMIYLAGDAGTASPLGALYCPDLLLLDVDVPRG